MENPWLTFDFTSRNQVHEQDQESFDRFNSKVKKLRNGKNLELSSCHTPLPYFGNLRAGFVILMANPGLDPVNTSREEKPHMRRLFDAARKHEEMDSPFVFLDDAFAGTPGHTWWSKRLGSIIDEVGLEKVRNGIFSAENTRISQKITDLLVSKCLRSSTQQRLFADLLIKGLSSCSVAPEKSGRN